MTVTLIIHKAGPGLTIQDQGRSGWLRFGVSRGGAADDLALAEGAALLGQPADTPALELAGFGGVFEVTHDTRIALTGAPMSASIGETRLTWNASYLLAAHTKLTIGAPSKGVYGYLHLGGGIAADKILGACSTHLSAGIGGPLSDGQSLRIGQDQGGHVGQRIDAAARFDGGALRVVPSFQTDLFTSEDIRRFQATDFQRDTRGNRMGVRLTFDGPGFQTAKGRSILSDVVVPGDIQITGDGTPFVLMTECQTTGGYPRIATVLPCDLRHVAQAAPGTPLSFRFVSLDEAVDLVEADRKAFEHLHRRVTNTIRDPSQMADLLSHQLVSGVVTGHEKN